MMPAPTITTSAPATFMAVATIRQSRGVLNDLDEAHVIFYLLRADHPVRADHLSIGLTLVPAAAGRPLGDVRLQISTAWGGTAITVSLLRDLTRRLDRSVRVVVLLDPDSDGAGVRRLLRECLGRERSIRVFSVEFGTIFARDNALAARDRRGRPVLLVPRALRSSAERSSSSAHPPPLGSITIETGWRRLDRRPTTSISTWRCWDAPVARVGRRPSSPTRAAASSNWAPSSLTGASRCRRTCRPRARGSRSRASIARRHASGRRCFRPTANAWRTSGIGLSASRSCGRAANETPC